jgi:hypothetical protein
LTIDDAPIARAEQPLCGAAEPSRGPAGQDRGSTHFRENITASVSGRAFNRGEGPAAETIANGAE